MSLMPSSTITSRTPGWSRTSRLNRARALCPKHAELLSTRFPPMPSSMTAGASLPSWPSSRRARKSGQRPLVPSEEPTPSVIESPNATTTPARL